MRAPRLLLATCLVLATLAGAAPAAGQNLPLNADPEVIVGERVIADGTYTLTKNYLVGPGATLVIRNATVYLDQKIQCPARGGIGDVCTGSIMVKGGTLRITDSIVDTSNPRKTFNNSGELYGRPWLITGYGGVIHIERSLFLHNREILFQYPGPEPSTVRDSAFVGGTTGVAFIRGALAHIEGNVFQDLNEGVHVRDAPSLIRDNAFLDTTIGVNVQFTLAGEKVFETAPTIEGNRFEGNTIGIYHHNGFGHPIVGNVFRGNALAAFLSLNVDPRVLHKDAPRVEGNLFDGNVNATMFAIGGDTPTRVSLVMPMSGNAFVNTQCVEAKITPHPRVDLLVDARGNWWGSSDGPASRGAACPATIGNVLVDPWLTEAPPSPE